MSEVELTENPPVIDVSLEKYPRSWYEHQDLVGFGAAALSGTIAYFQERYFPVGNLVEHLGGIALLTSGHYFDHQSTKQGFIAKDEAVSAGLEPVLKETNPLLGDPASLDEYTTASKKKNLLLVESALLMISVVIPPFGYAIGASRYAAVANNRRVVKRIKYAAELASVESTG